MSKYSLEVHLKTYNIEKSLLKDLENYIFRKAKEIANPSDDEIKKRYKFTINDSIGTEEMQSVSDYNLSYFPDDTESVSYSLELYNPTNLSIKIRFSKERSSSIINISYAGQSAREIVNGIIAEIKYIIKPYKNLNSIFYPPEFLYGFLTGFAVSLLVIVLYIFNEGYLKIGFFVGIFTLLIILYLLISKLKPYSVFHTKKNIRLEKLSNWFFWGIIGFFLFSILGIFLRKTILGF